VTGPVPDPLRRFVPTPHTAALSQATGELRIESNDAAFTAQSLEYFRSAPPVAIKHLKIIVEHSLPQDGEELTQVDAGALRTVLRGTNTVLIHDAESRELLAFLAQGVAFDEFVQRLLPALVHRESQLITNG
jgi:hypothetical protein